MIIADDLLQIRKMSDDYRPSCPIHVPIASCRALFTEAGLTASPEAAGCLGDIMENFALLLMQGLPGPQVTRDQLAEKLRMLLQS